MFKRVLDCWSSKTPPLPLLLQYVRVWISYCGDMSVVQQQGLRTFRYMGHPTYRFFDMVQIIHVSMYSNKDMPCLVQCSRGSLTPGHPTTPAVCGSPPSSIRVVQTVACMVQNVAHVWNKKCHIWFKM